LVVLGGAGVAGDGEEGEHGGGKVASFEFRVSSWERGEASDK
jgi:hypothetical protein